MRRLMLLCCLLLPAPLWAEPMTLQQAIDLALAHAPAVKAAEAGRDAAAEDASIGLAGLLPRVDANGSLQRRKQTSNYDVPQTFFKTRLNYTENRIGLKVVQPLFDLERWAGYRQGELSAETGDLKLRLERQRLMLEAAQAVLDVANAQAAVVAAQAREEAAGKLAAQAEASFKVGASAMTDRLDAEARHDLARADRLKAENDLDQAKATLASLTGETVEGVVPPPLAENPAEPAPADPAAWENRAAEQAIPVLLSGLQLDVAKEGEQKALGGALPKVEAFAEINRDRSGDTQLGSGATVRDQSVGVQVNMPLFAGGGNLAQVRKSEKEALQAEFSLADDKRLARLTARQAYLALEAAAAQVSAMQKASVSAKQAAEAAHLGHEVGLRTVTEVLDADERNYTAEKDLAAARSQYVFANLQLRASVGELTDKPLPNVYGENP
ncbi:MAG TPA: TolC family outer membrane protein [Mariprofundaceae bacterium]|nr:TolC family outer membrane protein [Mariprofundaceae bacterium]